MSTATAVAEPVPAGEFQSFQGNLAHSGFVSVPGLTPPLVAKWTADVASNSPSYPVVVDGRVFVTAGRPDGEFGEGLYAFDEQTGYPLWYRPLGPDGHWSAPAADGDRVFAFDDDGVLRAFDATTGDLLWTRQAGPSEAPPVASGGVLYFGDAYGIHALDDATGHQLWLTRIDHDGGRSAPAIGANQLYVSYECKIAAALNLDGSRAWSFDGSNCEGTGGATPALHNGKLYFSAPGDDGLVLDAATGHQLATYPYGTVPAFKDNVAIFSSGGQGPTNTDPYVLKAVDESTGRTLWQTSADGELNTPPLIVNDTAYVGSWSGTLYGFDVSTGNVVVQTNVAEPFFRADENNATDALTGLGAGDGLLLAPAGNQITAYAAATGPTPPAATTEGASAIEDTSVALHGLVNPNRLHTTYRIEWGKTTAYGNDTPTPDGIVGSDDSNHEQIVRLDGLTPGTTYHLRVVATNSAGTTYGRDAAFTTSGTAPAPPTAESSGATSVGQTDATLTGDVDPNGSDTSYYFEWGIDSTYGSQSAAEDAGSGTTSSTVEDALSSLTPGTTYHYRLVATNAGGTTYGADTTFTTAPAPQQSPPQAGGSSASAPAPTTPLNLSVRVPRSVSPAALLRGLRIVASCSVACSIEARWTDPAKRLTLAVTRWSRPGTSHVLTLRLTSAARHRIGRIRKLRTLLRLTASSGTSLRAVTAAMNVKRPQSSAPLPPLPGGLFGL